MGTSPRWGGAPKSSPCSITLDNLMSLLSSSRFPGDAFPHPRFNTTQGDTGPICGSAATMERGKCFIRNQRCISEYITKYIELSLRCFLISVRQFLNGSSAEEVAQQQPQVGGSSGVEGDGQGGEDSMAREVKQMAMEAFLREKGLQAFTPRLLELGIKSVEDLANPGVMSDHDLVSQVGMELSHVGLFRQGTMTVSAHLPANVRKSIVLQQQQQLQQSPAAAPPPLPSLPPPGAEPPAAPAPAPPPPAPPTAAAAPAAAAPSTSSSLPAASEVPGGGVYLPRSLVLWNGWLEKRGRSAFSKARI